jgi:hypothetical protein
MTTETPKIELPNDIWKLILNESKETWFEKLKKDIISEKKGNSMITYMNNLRHTFIDTLKKYQPVSIKFYPFFGVDYNEHTYCYYISKSSQTDTFVMCNNINKYIKRRNKCSFDEYIEFELNIEQIDDIDVNEENWGVKKTGYRLKLYYSSFTKRYCKFFGLPSCCDAKCSFVMDYHEDKLNDNNGYDFEETDYESEDEEN